MRTETTPLLPLLLLTAAAGAQDGSDLPYIRLSYPDDAERVVSRVNGDDVTLEDVLRHIDERHSPGFAFLEFMADEGRHYLDSRWIARWVRYDAYTRALRQEARHRGLDLDQADVHLGKALQRGFEKHLEAYTGNLRRRGLDFEPTQDRIDTLLAKYQRQNGLETEVQGWLDFMVDVEGRTREELRDFYRDHARYFGGAVDLAHILVYHRHPSTGILLTEEGRKRAVGRRAEIESRLKEDGSNFEEVAELLSDDRRTGERGGVLEGVRRFDPRLPAELVRTAWFMKDGQVSDVVESPYGWHYVKRLSFTQTHFILFTDDAIPTVRATMRKHLQEELLFEARERWRVELKL